LSSVWTRPGEFSCLEVVEPRKDQPGLFTRVILSAAKDLDWSQVTQILRCAQDDIDLPDSWIIRARALSDIHPILKFERPARNDTFAQSGALFRTRSGFGGGQSHFRCPLRGRSENWDRPRVILRPVLDRNLLGWGGKDRY
jgi:hypothetical protein